MNQTILISNRALPFEGGAELPKRIHIVPRGELKNADAGVTQVLDEPALNAILADLQNRHAAKGGLYLGEEHFIYNDDRSSQAFAWGKKFGLDADGIWVEDPEYTDVGAPAIKNKRFKFTSFVADRSDPTAVEDLGNGKLRILKIDTVGFTNFANGKNLLTPITNRDDLPAIGGVWRTINGTHIFIKEGESEAQAIERSVKHRKGGYLKVSANADEASRNASSASTSAKDSTSHRVAAERHRDAASHHSMAARYSGKDEESRNYHEAMAREHSRRATEHENKAADLRNREGETMQLLLNVKKSSQYQNEDGTFKEHQAPGEKSASKFGGCVLHMMHNEGHSEESARKICGSIAAMKNRAAPAADADPDDLCSHAMGMTQDAMDDSTVESHSAAMDAHKKSGAAMRDAGRHDEAAMHEAMAEHHGRMIKHLADATVKNRISSGNPAGGQQKETKMKTVLTELGLSADANEETALAAVKHLKNRVTALEGEQIDALLAERKITDDKIVNRLKPILTPLKNREDRLACLDELGFKAETKTAARVLNRGGANKAVAESAATDGDEQAKADKLMNRARELKGQSAGRSFDDCWRQAQRESTAVKN